MATTTPDMPSTSDSTSSFSAAGRNNMPPSPASSLQSDQLNEHSPARTDDSDAQSVGTPSLLSSPSLGSDLVAQLTRTIRSQHERYKSLQRHTITLELKLEKKSQEVQEASTSRDEAHRLQQQAVDELRVHTAGPDPAELERQLTDCRFTIEQLHAKCSALREQQQTVSAERDLLKRKASRLELTTRSRTVVQSESDSIDDLVLRRLSEQIQELRLENDALRRTRGTELQTLRAQVRKLERSSPPKRKDFSKCAELVDSALLSDSAAAAETLSAPPVKELDNVDRLSDSSDDDDNMLPDIAAVEPVPFPVETTNGPLGSEITHLSDSDKELLSAAVDEMPLATSAIDSVRPTATVASPPTTECAPPVIAESETAAGSTDTISLETIFQYFSLDDDDDLDNFLLAEPLTDDDEPPPPPSRLSPIPEVHDETVEDAMANSNHLPLGGSSKSSKRRRKKRLRLDDIVEYFSMPVYEDEEPPRCLPPAPSEAAGRQSGSGNGNFISPRVTSAASTLVRPPCYLNSNLGGGMGGGMRAPARRPAMRSSARIVKQLPVASKSLVVVNCPVLENAHCLRRKTP